MTWLFWLIVVLVALPLAGWLYQRMGEYRDAIRFPAPGRFTEGKPERLHVHVEGERGCPVVLESGIAASSLGWRYILNNAAAFARVMAYDRAGLGWSDPTAKPRTIENLIEELDRAIATSELPPPFVMVGHSFGGYLLRHYAALRPGKVAALILLDPLDPAEWCPCPPPQQATLDRGVMLSRRGAFLARLGVVRFALSLLTSGSRLAPKLIARASSGRAAGITERLVGEVRKMPKEVWPMVEAHWCQPKSFLGMAGYLESLPANCAFPPDDEALREIPLYVVSAANATPVRRRGHARLASLSKRGVLIEAEDCGHWVHLDKPTLVLRLIREACGAAPAPAAINSSHNV